MAKTSILDKEAAHFGGMAADWWDPDGKSAMLHKLNPVRLAYVRDQVDQHFSCDEHGFRPLEGKSALDVGCGAGLLAEPLARLGADVTGVDAAAEVIEVARAHAKTSGLDIRYSAGGVENIEGVYDLVTAMEVVEHVADPAAFVADLAQRVADGGLLIMSTPNKTAWSRLLTITLAEGFGQIPRGTHDYDQFLPPEELTALVEAAGMKVVDTRGLAVSALKGFHLSEDTRLNYLLTAVTA